MKRHVQMTGVRRWAGNDLVELQQQPLQAIDAFFAEYGNCILKGCEVVQSESENTYNVTPGFVALAGIDQDNNETFKVVPFAGIEGVTLPIYLTLAYSVIERPYTDGKVKPIAYDFRAAASSILPENVSSLEISVTGGRQFVDAIRLTDKLDQTGNGRDVTVTFGQATNRENVSSGEKLSVLWGKVCRWFTDLKTVAFSGKTADLVDDENHRLTTDTEKARWNDTYTQQETDDKDAEILRVAKEYAGNQVTDLGNDVYRKTDTYNRTEIETQDTAVLDAAKKYVMDRVGEVISGSPAALDTLYEIANALNNDPNFATTIMAIINGKADTAHKHTKNQITDFPSSLPASDVPAWAKQPNKPTYNAAEVGAATAGHNHNGVYQPAGSYAAANHNHNGTYAPASHKHTADQITDTNTKVMMTAEERSKLANMDGTCIPDVKVRASDGYIYIYHDKLPDKLSKLDPQIVFLRSKKIYRHRAGGRPAQKRWCDIKDRTIGLADSVDGNDYFKFQLSPEKWNLLRRRSDGQAPTISALTYAFIGRRINQNGVAQHVISFCTGEWRYATIGNKFVRKGLFALAIRVNNPDFPDNGIANGIPKYLYGNLTTFNLTFCTDRSGICCTNVTLL